MLPYFGGYLIEKHPPVLLKVSNTYRNGRSSVIIHRKIRLCFAPKSHLCSRSEPENPLEKEVKKDVFWTKTLVSCCRLGMKYYPVI